MLSRSRVSDNVDYTPALGLAYDCAPTVCGGIGRGFFHGPRGTKRHSVTDDLHH